MNNYGGPSKGLMFGPKTAVKISNLQKIFHNKMNALKIR
jgi:hypothetical protein